MILSDQSNRISNLRNTRNANARTDANMEPASATGGFFQPLPILKNQAHDDPSIKRILKLYVPEDVARIISPELHQLGEEVLEPHIFDWVVDAERNQPYISGTGKNAFGKPTSSKLVVAEGWKKLQELGFKKGMAAQGYEQGLDQYTRVVQYLRSLIYASSDANTSCPAAMQDGAALLLKRHLEGNNLDSEKRRVFQNAFEHLISRDPSKAWTSGQWMTERIGGSDVSRSETVATYSPLSVDAPLCDPSENIPLGPWSIDGFKWFSSATDSNMTILLAKTPKGLSAFYAPMRRHDPNLVVSATGKAGGTELNGVTISRLKNKLGTKSLPTAELELRGMRGWLIGQEGQGIKEIATILTVARVRSAVGGLGYLSRGLSIARSFAEVREVGAGRGKRMKLTDSSLHMRTLANMTTEYHGMMLLTFYTCYVMGIEEHPTSARGPPSAIEFITPRPGSVSPLIRILTPLLKAYCTKQVVPLLYACMESLGGVGFLENSETEYLNVARLFRDACVLNIWEGTTDVLTTDLIRALKHPKLGADSIHALDSLVKAGDSVAKNTTIIAEWKSLKANIEQTPQDDLLVRGRDILWKVAEILMALLYLINAENEGTAAIKYMCSCYLRSKGFLENQDRDPKTGTMQSILGMDQAVVLGDAVKNTGEGDRASKQAKL